MLTVFVVHIECNGFGRIPRWTTTAGDGNTVDVSYAHDLFDCLRLNVSRVPCIVTLSKVLYMTCIFLLLLTKCIIEDFGAVLIAEESTYCRRLMAKTITVH